MKIESSDTNIEQLFTSSFLEIPRFQRPYSWDDENIDDFWRDTVVENSDDYFIGSMVVYSSGRQQYGVVDGQQRLTTITILLCAIRDEFIKNGNEALAKGLHSLIEKADRDSLRRYVLKTETTYPFFQEIIQKYDEPDFAVVAKREENRIESAYDIFSRKLGNIIEKIREEKSEDEQTVKEAISSKLREIRDRILFLRLIKVELENEDDAYLIFETLNTRGKDLALSDLLKNHFTKLIKGKQDVDYVKHMWTMIFENLQGATVEIEPDTFFTNSWSSRFESTTQQKAYRKIKDAVSKQNAKKQLGAFAEDSGHYKFIFNPPPGRSNEERSVVKSLNAMRMFRITQQIPAVLSLVRAKNQGIIRPRVLARALRAVENFHFLFTALTSSRSSGGISAMYTSFGRRIYDAANSNEAGIIINDLIEKLNERKPTRTEVLAGFENLHYTSAQPKQGPLIKYTLQRIARFQNLAFSEDSIDLTIEHIHPQSKGTDDWTAHIIGQVGNLILLSASQNGEVKDGSFAQKKRTLQQWPQTVPADVLQAKDWTPDVARERTRQLAMTAYDHVWTVA